MVEIGPGKGALTRHLLPLTEELHAIELDRALIQRLESQFGVDTRFHLHSGDVLATDLAQWGPAVIVGNLPYYITSPIIDRFLELGETFSRAVFLIQKEVADRLRAGPGSRDYGFFSVVTQMVADVRLVCEVPPNAFSPPPKVDSAVILLERKKDVPEDVRGLRQFLSRCFAHKRKTLRNNLRPFFPPALVDAVPEAGLRAEQLSLDQFRDLQQRLQDGPGRDSL